LIDYYPIFKELQLIDRILFSSFLQGKRGISPFYRYELKDPFFSLLKDQYLVQVQIKKENLVKILHPLMIFFELR